MEKYITLLKKALNIQPLMDKLKSGQIIRQILSVFFRFVAGVLGLALLWLWLRMWRGMDDVNFLGKLALLIWQAAFLYASVLVVKILCARAAEIMDYPDSDYVVVPVIAMLMKTKGQMLLVFFGIISVPAMLMVWFGGGALCPDSGNAFVSGIVAFILSWMIGFLSLIVAQFCAEWTLAVFSIASDMSILRRNAVPEKVNPENTEAG